MAEHVAQEVLSPLVEDSEAVGVADRVLELAHGTRGNFLLHYLLSYAAPVPQGPALTRLDDFLGEFNLNVIDLAFCLIHFLSSGLSFGIFELV